MNNENVEVADFSKFLSIMISVILMCIGLTYTVSLLKWTIDNKFDQLTPIVNSDITAQKREQQLACLAKNIYHEAGSEPFEGKVAVAQVTLNRVASGLFPNDVCQVIYQKNIFYEKVVCQFSWYCDRDSSFKPINKKAYEESMTVAKKVLLENFRLPSLTTAMYYHADYINPGWKKERITQVGHHIFYR
jgi:spore germination cell wall hydrolase CwlJ-like protein